jgi:hypothetical protein
MPELVLRFVPYLPGCCSRGSQVDIYFLGGGPDPDELAYLAHDMVVTRYSRQPLGIKVQSFPVLR